MRSELIFKALAHEPNRYLLCRLVAKGTRKLHRPNTRVQNTTNQVLEHFIKPLSTLKAVANERVSEHKRRAA